MCKKSVQFLCGKYRHEGRNFERIIQPELKESAMIVGLDIDDTITRHPEFFSFLSGALVRAGHTVVIITFRENRKAVEEYLDQCSIAYSRLVTATLESSFEYGVDQWKSAMCRKYGVDILFDDDPKSLRYVDASTFCMMPVQTGRLSAVR